MKAITESTAVSISLVIAICGGIGWLTSIYKTTEANAIDVARLKERNELILEKLARIEERLDYLIKHKEDK